MTTMQIQKKLSETYQLIRKIGYLKYVFLFQRYKHKEILSEINTLATKFEWTVFPSLLKTGQAFVKLEIAHSRFLMLDRCDGSKPQEMPSTSATADYLTRQGIKTLQFDTRLESNQIVEALTILLQAAPTLAQGFSERAQETVSSDRALVAALHSDQGFHQYCTRMNYHRTGSRYVIHYSYCELIYTANLNLFLHGAGRSKNHRALFSLAGPAGFGSGLFILLLFLVASGFRAFPLGMIAALFCGGIISYLITTLASLVYDQEHRDMLIRENVREIETLSHFPLNNPNPIIKVDRQGKILFSNRSARRLVEKMGFNEDQIEKLLPENLPQLIVAATERGRVHEGIEVARHGRTIRYLIAPFPSDNAVLLSGTDMTKHQRLQDELNKLNESLEQKVVERTLEIEQTQDVTILSLSALAETRDKETGDHIERTRLFVKLLAEQLKTNPRFRRLLKDDKVIELLYRSAPLHDIGKVGIPDAILQKPGRLTPKEFNIMKLHTTYGGDTLRWAEKQLGSNSFLKYAQEIAYNHHERWDGSGYPQGLKGREIPISARLMALADVYDALINPRVYKGALPATKVKSLILQGRESHFDPDVVDAFLGVEEQFVKIAEEHSEKPGPPMLH